MRPILSDMATADNLPYSDSLFLGDDGIWRSADAPESLSYPAGANDVYASIEERSFWFRHRNACIVAAVTRLPPPRPGPIFDIGGGNGFVASALVGAGFDTAVVEPGPGAHHAKRRGLRTVICASSDSARFNPTSLPAVGLFDVVEHMADDLAFLRSMHAALIPGGRIYLTVPAHAWLWSDEDTIAGHFRRYSLAMLTDVVRRAGLRVEFASYFFRVLPLPIAALRVLPYRLGRRRTTSSAAHVASDHAYGVPALALLGLALRGERRRIAEGVPMHFGASCILVASRPTN